MATRINGQTEKECEGHEGHSDNDAGTVAFLRLPALMILRGDGSAVECRVLHNDTVGDV